MEIETKSFWDTPYGHATLKVERAKKHIDDFTGRILASPDCHGVGLYMDNQTGEHILYYAFEDHSLRGELAVIAGDVIHNLRSALDIAWLGIVKEIGNPKGTWTKFPIDPEQPKQWLEGALSKTAGINPNSRIYDFLVNHVKGYKGGDTDILALHDLNIDDKHRLLITTVYVTGITGIELENEDGTIDVFNIVLLTHREFYRRVVPSGSKLKNHGTIQFHVTFGEGTGFVEGEDMISTLERWQGKIWELLRWLQSIK